MEKKRVGFVTSSILVKTGFSTNIKAILPYLYKTNKYELFHLNQSITDGDPNLQRFPWHNEGVYRNGGFDIELFNKDEAYRRFVSYGNLAVESFILRNKLDILIHIEDPWSSDPQCYTKSKWFPYLKNNFLQWTTIDSLPPIPIYMEYASECPNCWFWASFAVKYLQKKDPEKYKHLDWSFGCLDINEFLPISKEEKLSLRDSFNIDRDDVIFIQLGRNQLRKLFPASMEAFALFKQRYPNYKAKLYFHCNWLEGWPLERLTSDFNLKKEDILTTYYCKNCSRWEIKPFEGEERPCKFCGNKNHMMTAGVHSPIVNEELSKLYGIADASLSIFTSGGMEYTNPQSLLCGLPLLCTDYSSGEDFVQHDFIFKLDGTFAYEIGSGFKKHTPNLETIVKFYKTICDLSPEERKIIGDKGRKWALETFDVKVIGKKLEDWIDSREPHNWDYVYKLEAKNPNAEVQNIEDNMEWLKALYKDILKMSVTDKDSGLLYWMNMLNTGTSRKAIEDYFRKVASDENIKIIPQKTIADFINKNDKKKLLIVIKESIGDILNATSLFKSFKTQYKDHEIYVACDQQYIEILDCNDYVDVVIPYHPSMEKELEMTGQGQIKGFFDVFCHLTLATQRQLNYLTNDRIALQLK